MKFCTRVRLKPSNNRGEFELDRARSKNNIAENSIALGHDTHNRNKIDAVPSFKAVAVLNLYLLKFENHILEIQVQEQVGEFQA